MVLDERVSLNLALDTLKDWNTELCGQIGHIPMLLLREWLRKSALT